MTVSNTMQSSKNVMHTHHMPIANKKTQNKTQVRVKEPRGHAKAHAAHHRNGPHTQADKAVYAQQRAARPQDRRMDAGSAECHVAHSGQRYKEDEAKERKERRRGQ